MARIPRSTLFATVHAALLLGGTAMAQNTWRISVDPSGAEADGDTFPGAMSDDGRFVVFAGDAANLVPGDTNGCYDIFVRDRLTGTTARVSVDSAGLEADAASYGPRTSSDARIIGFDSYATNLVSNDTNGTPDVFVHDRQTGSTTRVSVDSAGSQGNGYSGNASLSADGRLVAFMSSSSNLVPNDTNARNDAFVHDRLTAKTIRVSVDSSGRQADLGAFATCAISGDGRFVAFESYATNLVPGDTNGYSDIFLRDLQANTTIRVSVDSTGAQANGKSYYPRLSADGRLVVYESYASNLVAGDTNQAEDVFLYDRMTQVTSRLSVDSQGAQGNSRSMNPTISTDGRCAAFASFSTNLVPGDTNGKGDVFWHDLATGVTTRVSVSQSGTQGNDDSFLPALNEDGRFVAFESKATDLVPNDTNASWDSFVRGPSLTLEATPETVPPGGSLTLLTWGGLPGGASLLAAVDVNGIPLFRVLARGRFDAVGRWTRGGQVPPMLAGSVVTFLAFGVDPTGRADSTNRERVTFQ